MIFFIGIKGAGMAALACMLKESGQHVEGSDLTKHFFTEEQLHDLQIPVHPFGVLPPDGSTVIVGNAFKDDHPDVAAVKANPSLKIYRYHEYVGELTRRYTTIALTGSHGKTTTTTMMAAVLSAYAPTAYLIGDGHGHLSADSRYLAIEADEYRRFFLAYFPKYAVVTNVDLDHVDYYKDEADYRSAYEAFANNVSSTLVLFGDDPEVRKLKLTKPHLYYGIEPHNDVVAEILEEKPTFTRFNLVFKGHNIGEIRLPFSGRHLVWNALGTITVAVLEGIPISVIQEGIARFKGAARRFVVEDHGANVYIDDYAHHPTEVSVTIDAARLRYPHHKLVAIFKPHRVSRVYRFAQEFAVALDKADAVYLCDFTAIDDKEPGIDIDINYLKDRSSKAVVVTEDEAGARVLAQEAPAVYLFMSSKDIYVLSDALKRYQKP
jgi:UDP-N-acetylmuramate--alanine ligase